MSAAVLAEPTLLHATPGRIRVHVPDLTGQVHAGVVARLRRLPGVLSAQVNSITGNALVRFDAAETSPQAILDAVRRLDTRAIAGGAEGVESRAPSLPVALRDWKSRRRVPFGCGKHGDTGRARITVRGLDRDPSLARAVVERLRALPGVRRVSASVLTGRVLVEYERHCTDIDSLLSHVADVELPELPEEDRPAHPLDPGALIQSAARTLGAGLGLGLLALQRLTGFQIAPGLRGSASRVAATIGILQGFPVVRYGLRRLAGRDVGDLLVYVPTIVSLTLAGSPLGLAVTGSEALRLLTEIVARRSAWRRYEDQLATFASAEPGSRIRLESGERTPLAARVVEGFGTATGRDGLPLQAAPGETLPAGARLYGGPFVLDLSGGAPFIPGPRPAPVNPTIYQRYVHALGPISFGYAAITALATRSLRRTFAALMLVTPRTALIGGDAADTGAAARVLRAGVTMVGTRPERRVHLPQSLLIDAPRTLTDGYEVTGVLPAADQVDSLEIPWKSLAAGADVVGGRSWGAQPANDMLALASAVAVAAGSPWGGALRQRTRGYPDEATDGSFDGTTAGARLEGVRYTLSPVSDWRQLPAAARLRFQGEHLLMLEREDEEAPIGFLGLRPRLAAGVSDLVDTCRRHGVELGLVAAGNTRAAQLVSRRTEIPLVEQPDAMSAIRERQESGARVAFLGDSAEASEAFAACDLAIGLSSGRSSRFPARADLLAPDMAAVSAVVEAGARRESAARDSVILSIGANAFGAAWGLRSDLGIARASQAVYATALAALADGWLRLRGGERSISSITRLVDPRPERWGRRSLENVLKALNTSDRGLTSSQALERRQTEARPPVQNRLLTLLLDQVRSPLTGILAGGAVLSLILGSTADVVVIGATLVANAVVGAWQEHQAGQAVAALERIGTTTARVLRDGQTVVVPAGEVVPGDILVLAPGDRVAADARLISAHGLEVDEASLTGESLPVNKAPTGGTDSSRIVLAGSDVTVGTGHAVVFAVGRRTRMGATAAALAMDETRGSPLGMRLNRALRLVLPLAGVGGLIVLGAGLLRGQGLLPQLAVGAAIAIAAVPEGLPLLAGVGEAAVARRLATRGALVRRLSAVEALGRVDVACSDKTGTLTEGRLVLSLVAMAGSDDAAQGISASRSASPSTDLPPGLRLVLLTAGLATPHPEAADAMAHPTDVVVRQGAESAGLGTELRARRLAESSFDPAQPYHVALVDGRLCVKGATEALVARCATRYAHGHDEHLDEAGRGELLQQAEKFASRGLRVLMVADGPSSTSVHEPEGLRALGFVGISDPLRADVPEAVRRCHQAGIRVVMLTGDHPSTARAVAREAGILEIPAQLGLDSGELLTGSDISGLQDGELDLRLERAAVIARVTPLDKLRIVESLQRHGHVVAMTGDGVNDAPALRLADVGVAMGRGGTEVVRQAAAVVLADDDFSTLVEALVEGRGFWQNIRRAVALLLGGNLGELGLMVGGSILGVASPLIPRQILAVNLVTDVLPSLAVALQQPESRNLSELAREGTVALDRSLRNDVMRRGIATTVPSLAAYLVALPSGGLPQARSVAFASVVTTQLAQTLAAGRAEGMITRSVLGAVAGSAAVLVGALTLPPLRGLLALTTPSPAGWLLIGAASLVAAVLGHGFPVPALRARALLPRPQPAGTT